LDRLRLLRARAQLAGMRENVGRAVRRSFSNSVRADDGASWHWPFHAGAILALSRDERHSILDGNVKRVLSRTFGIDGDPSSKAVLAHLWDTVRGVHTDAGVAAYTQAIMDLGATLCTRTRPACTMCPMNEGCVAALQGRQAELPGRKPKRIRPSREATLLIAQTGSNGSSAVLVERRPAAGLWGGLWSLPQFESAREAIEWCVTEFGDAVELRSLPPIDHAFTHFDLRLKPIQVQCGAKAAVRDGAERLWYQLNAPPRVGLPQPILRLFERLRTTGMA